MELKHVILDSGAYAKLFLQEAGKDELIALLKYIADNDLRITCPDIFLYEVLSVASQHRVPLQTTVKMIRQLENAYLSIQVPTSQQFSLAMRMTEEGHEKSGYPSIYDSTYHAMAISYGGVFVTTDKRHIAKAKHHGHVVLLQEWKSAFTN